MKEWLRGQVVHIGASLVNCTLFDNQCNSCTDTDDCYYCTSNAKCVDKYSDDACSNSDQVGSGTCFYKRYHQAPESSILHPLLRSNSRSTFFGLFRNSLIDAGEFEWMCIICGFDNRPKNTYCTLCGTSFQFTEDYKNEKREHKKMMKLNQAAREKEDIVLPEEAQIHVSNPLVADEGHATPAGSPARDSKNIAGRPSLSPAERREAFNYRRLNQLSLRQKEARRRKMWRRITDNTTGELKWIRVPIVETAASVRIYESRESSFSESNNGGALANLFYSIGNNKNTNQNRSDSFGDSTLFSSSPGFTSILREDGGLSWEKVESGKLATSSKLPSVSVEHGAEQPQFNPVYNFSIPATEDLQNVAAMTFKEKQLWFIKQLAALQKPWSQGCVRVDVNRDSILYDAHKVFQALNPGDLHKWMRVVFIGEPGIDAGGLEREWFALLTKEIFNPSTGLFTSSARDTSAGQYHVNPISLCSVDNEEKSTVLSYYRFVGRFIGKSLMEQQNIAATLSLPLRKQILSLPITFSDLEFVDEELFRNLRWLKVNKGVDALSLDFLVTYDVSNQQLDRRVLFRDVTRVQEIRVNNTITLELVGGGGDIAVNDENKEEYLTLRLKNRMLDSIKQQLEQLLFGIYEIIPPDLLSVFDYQELELLMCGVPDIDLADWIRHTDYLGEYSRQGGRNRVIRWFWLTVESFSREERVRLLQFVTGCSRLPPLGFKGLMSNDGNYRKFNIQSINKTDSLYPRAHTCFNKLDLPVYDSQAELEAYLSIVISTEVTGFTIE